MNENRSENGWPSERGKPPVRGVGYRVEKYLTEAGVEGEGMREIGGIQGNIIT